MKESFPFEERIKQLVLHIDSMISNVEQISVDGSEKFGNPLKSVISNVLSCQIVNFGSESGKLNKYEVYNYCHLLNIYEEELEKHFEDYQKNKSIISIKKDKDDDGIWYSKREPKKIKQADICLEYQKRITYASYEVYSNEEECKVQWENWKDLMFGIYENANSVFSKNLKIGLSDNNYLYSGIYLTFSTWLNYKQIGIIGRICETLLNEISFEDLIPNLHKNIQSHALQSAVAQIFARNFAHNIGSHVAIRATNRLAKERLADLYKSNIESILIKDVEKKVMPKDIFFREKDIENWLDYMGEKLDLFEVARNEFLAEYKLPGKNVMFYRNVILPFCENILLFDNIAHSEGINYKDIWENKLKIKVIIKNKGELRGKYPLLESYTPSENEIIYPDNFPYLVKPKTGSIEDAFNRKDIIDINGNSIRDIEICLTSEHTLYSILENFIRNSAKHNKGKTLSDERELVITLYIEDCDSEFYSIQIYDNISRVSQKQLNEFSESINDSLVTNNGEIQKKNLGIADIKINAHLLKTDADIANQSLKDSLTLVYQENKNDFFKPYSFVNEPSLKNEYNFGYQFNLCKPKKVLWIGKEDIKNEFISKGLICFRTNEEFRYLEKKNNGISDPLAKYQFAILELDAVSKLSNDLNYNKKIAINIDNDSSFEWDDLLNKLPFRVLLNITSEEYISKEHNLSKSIKELIENGRIQLVKTKLELPNSTKDKYWDFELIKKCWENWFIRWDIDKNNKGNLVLYFEDELFAEKWKELNIEQGSIINIISLYSENGNLLGDTEKIHNIKNEDKVVVYDHHSMGFKLMRKFCNKLSLNFITKDAFFAFDKSSPDYHYFTFPPENLNDKILLAFEAMDAGLTKILIVDERVSEKISTVLSDTKGIYGNGFKSKGCGNFSQQIYGNISDLANNGNIFIISKFDFNKLSESENAEILSSIKNQQLEFTFKFLNVIVENDRIFNEPQNCVNFAHGLVIHRTYLQELFKSYKQLGQKQIMHSLYRIFKRVIVVSGGGYPHSLVVKTNFKPYSELSRCFLKYPSKYSLTKLL